MSLKLAEITVKNFKSCINIHLNLSDFTPLIGYNNAGKSNCLSAIQWILRKFVLSEKDYFDQALPVEMVGLIVGIEEAHLQTLDYENNNHRRSIEPYIQDGKLKIKRTQQTPSCKISDIKLFVWNWATNDWVANPTGIDNAIGCLFPEAIRISAMENAADDASKSKNTTTLGKLLNALTVSFQQQHGPAINSHLNNVTNLLSANGQNRLPELNQLDNAINSNIQDFFPSIGIKLHFDSPSFSDLFKAGTIKVIDDSQAERDFTSFGHGAQRSIQMGLIRYLAEIGQNHNNPKKTLLLIDEPELYLHPFAIEQLREALLQLSLGNYQIIISTHSTQMVTENLAPNALLIYKNQHEGTCVRQRLSDAVQRVLADHRAQADLLFSLNSSQILFSQQVLLVEGKTEGRLLPNIFYQYFNKTLAQCNYGFVAQNGSGNTGNTIKILREMGIPFKAISDLDYAFGDAISHGFISPTEPILLTCIEKIEEHAKSYDITVTKSTSNRLSFKDNSDEKRKSAKMLEQLASIEIIQPYIQELHNYFKEIDIWIWTQGTIEKPLGLEGKEESDWANFNAITNELNLESACNNYQEIEDLMNWIISNDNHVNTEILAQTDMLNELIGS